eukprot:Awhi_evm2s14542
MFECAFFIVTLAMVDFIVSVRRRFGVQITELLVNEGNGNGTNEVATPKVYL